MHTVPSGFSKQILCKLIFCVDDNAFFLFHKFGYIFVYQVFFE